MAPTHNITRRHQTKQRKKRRNKQIGTSTNPQNTEILPRGHTMFPKIHTQPFRENRQHGTTTQERKEMGFDDGPKYGIQQY